MELMTEKGIPVSELFFVPPHWYPLPKGRQVVASFVFIAVLSYPVRTGPNNRMVHTCSSLTEAG
jgi:hypothetical protein